MAERCILAGLQRAGVVRGDVEEMLSKRVAALFMPHGRRPQPYHSGCGAAKQTRQGLASVLAAPERPGHGRFSKQPPRWPPPFLLGACDMDDAASPALLAVRDDGSLNPALLNTVPK